MVYGRRRGGWWTWNLDLYCRLSRRRGRLSSMRDRAVDWTRMLRLLRSKWLVRRRRVLRRVLRRQRRVALVLLQLRVRLLHHVLLR